MWKHTPFMNSSPQRAFVFLVRHILLKPVQSYGWLKTAWTAYLGKSGFIYYDSDDDDDDDDDSNNKSILCFLTCQLDCLMNNYE